MTTENALIRLLADGQRHSGPELAARLGISRAAVWKAVQRAAERLGVEIVATKGQGYQLPEPLDLLDPIAIETMLPEAAARNIRQIQCFDEIPSTNTWLLEQSTLGAASGTIALAERQTAGRGRRGKIWISPYGANLYLSILWHFDSGPAALGALSLAAGAVVVQALQTLGIDELQLKWPNDIHWQSRKLAGLLIEIAGETQGPSRAVIGLGINVRMPADAAAAIDQPWTDLRTIKPANSPGRNRLAACCIEYLTGMLDDFARNGPTNYLEIWRQFDGYQGQPVTLWCNHHGAKGIHRGIDDQGLLKLEIDQQIRTFAAGELSLRNETK